MKSDPLEKNILRLSSIIRNPLNSIVSKNILRKVIEINNAHGSTPTRDSENDKPKSSSLIWELKSQKLTTLFLRP